MSRITRVFPFSCPVCGNDLQGFPTDEMFICSLCRIAVGFRVDSEPFTVPVRFAIVPEQQEQDSVELMYIPFWRCRCVSTITCTDEKKQERGRSSLPEEVWLNAARVRGLSTYGNFGLCLTEASPQITIDTEMHPIAGVGFSSDYLQKIVKYQVLALVDKHVDVTDMDLSVSIQTCELIGMPFYLSGNTLIEAVTGISIPSAVLEDLDGFRHLFSCVDPDI